AEEVVDAGAPVLDALHGLIRRSLLRKTGPRFWMLASIREFAHRQLTDDERRAVYERHAAWFGAAGVELQYYGRHGSSRDGTVERAPDLWAALERAETDPALRADGLRCALGLTAIYERRGPQAAVVRVVERALAMELPDDPGSRDRVAVLRSDACVALR